MQAILTKALAPSNTKGSRVKAVCEDGSVTIAYDHAQTVRGNHARAAMALVRKMGWEFVENRLAPDWICNTTPEGYAFVCLYGGMAYSSGFGREEDGEQS